MSLFDHTPVAQPSAESLAQREVALKNLDFAASIESIDELELNADVTPEELERGESVLTSVDNIIAEPEISAEALACAHDLVNLYQAKFFRRDSLRGGVSFSAEAISSRQQSISAEKVRGGVRATLSLVQRARVKIAA